MAEEALRCPITECEPPEYLTTVKDRGRFREIAELLQSVDEQLCTALDADQLARYVMSESVYIDYTKALKRHMRSNGNDLEGSRSLQRQQDVAFKQVQTCASALGLNVSSRLRFDLRKPEEPKRNKFADGLD